MSNNDTVRERCRELRSAHRDRSSRQHVYASVLGTILHSPGLPETSLRITLSHTYADLPKRDRAEKVDAALQAVRDHGDAIAVPNPDGHNRWWLTTREHLDRAEDQLVAAIEREVAADEPDGQRIGTFNAALDMVRDAREGDDD